MQHVRRQYRRCQRDHVIWLLFFGVRGTSWSLRSVVQEDKPRRSLSEMREHAFSCASNWRVALTPSARRDSGHFAHQVEQRSRLPPSTTEGVARRRIALRAVARYLDRSDFVRFDDSFEHGTIGQRAQPEVDTGGASHANKFVSACGLKRDEVKFVYILSFRGSLRILPA